MSPFPPPASVPAGWYPDPEQRGQRYWDGSAWTQQLAPAAVAQAPAPAPELKARTGDWVGGVLLSLFLPIVGLIVGVVYLAKGGEKRQVGIMCIALSCVAFFAWLAVTQSGGSDYAMSLSASLS
jgi:hypothetical protein